MEPCNNSVKTFNSHWQEQTLGTFTFITFDVILHWSYPVLLTFIEVDHEQIYNHYWTDRQLVVLCCRRESRWYTSLKREDTTASYHEMIFCNVTCIIWPIHVLLQTWNLLFSSFFHEIWPSKLCDRWSHHLNAEFHLGYCLAVTPRID